MTNNSPRRSGKAILQAIRREQAARSVTPLFTGRDNASRRAFQYTEWLAGRETPHSCNLPYSLESRCTFIGGRLYSFNGVEIPNWDFAPFLVELEPDDVIEAVCK